MLRLFFICIIIFNISNCNSILSTDEYTLKENIKKLCIIDEPIILHYSFETPNAVVGGLGSVVSSLNSLFSKKIHNCFVAAPYYSFLKNFYDEDHVFSLGFFYHMVFGTQKKTEVFYNHTLKQLLFMSDPTLSDLLTIVDNTQKIYEPIHNYSRIVYFASAVAKFADLIDVDIIHQHAWQTALTVPIIQKIYNPIRKSEQKKEIKIVSTIHMLNNEQGIDSNSLYYNVGLQPSETSIINLTASSIIESDHLTTVSKGLMNEFYNAKTSFGLSDLFIQKKPYISGITNGIEYENYTPYSPKNYRHLCLNENFTLEELALCKKNAKQLLFDSNLISSNEKPLMLYVGRLSSEKGIEFLEPIIESWLKLGGQMVVTGTFTNDKTAQRIIHKLQENEDLSDNLKIYTDLHNDQLAHISPQIQIQKGKLLRLAANFVCIPSKVESCGLTAMEVLSVGTPVFTSWVQGLKDFCYPLNVYHPILDSIVDEENFNSISYQYYPEDYNETIKDLQKNIELAYKITTGELISPENLLAAQQKMILTSKRFDWCALKGALDQYISLYNDIIDTTIGATNREDEQLSRNYFFNELVAKKMQLYPKNQMLMHENNIRFNLITTAYPIREPESQHNRPNLKEETLLTIMNNKLYLNDVLFDSEEMQRKNPNFYITWIMDKKGQIYAGAQCHAFYLKSKPGKPFYGFAKPIACGGDFKVKEGKITYIDNRSGHYKPTISQFKQVATYLYVLGVLDKDCEIRLEQTGKKINLLN